MCQYIKAQSNLKLVPLSFPLVIIICCFLQLLVGVSLVITLLDSLDIGFKLDWIDHLSLSKWPRKRHNLLVYNQRHFN